MSCNISLAGLPPTQFIPATLVDRNQYLILSSSFNSIYGCVQLHDTSLSNTAWYCSTSSELTSTSRRTESCNIGVMEDQCRQQYEITTANSKVNVRGCLQDVGETMKYCYFGGRKVTCTPYIASSDEPNRERNSSASIDSTGRTAIIIGTTIGVAALLSVVVFLIYRKKSKRPSNDRHADASKLGNSSLQMSETTIKGISENFTSVMKRDGSMPKIIDVDNGRMDGEGLAARMGEHPDDELDEIDGQVLEELNNIKHTSGTPRSSISSFTFGPPKKQSMIFDKVLPPLSSPPNQERRLSMGSNYSLRLGSDRSAGASPSFVATRLAPPVDDISLPTTHDGESTTQPETIESDIVLTFPRPYRTYVNLSDQPLNIPKSQPTGRSSRSTSPSRSVGNRSVINLNQAPVDTVNILNYIIDPLNFNGTLPVTADKPLASTIPPVMSTKNPQTQYRKQDLLSDWESIYALFYHLTYEGFGLAKKSFDSDSNGIPLHKTVFTVLARKSGLESDPILIASVTEFASSSDSIESNPNFYAFLSLLSQIICKSLLVPLSNPLYVSTYLKSLSKHFKYLPKNESSDCYKRLDQGTLFGHLYHTISTLSYQISQSSESRLFSHLFQILSHTATNIESLFHSYNLPIPTRNTIEELVKTSTITFLRMKTIFPGFAVFSANHSVDIERKAVVGVNLDVDVMSFSQGTATVNSVGSVGFGTAVFNVWPGLCDKMMEEVYLRSRVWVFKP